MATILLIEPDRLLAKNCTDYLKSLGHKVIWRVDPQEAVQWADKNLPDVVILDLLLANRSGIEFLYEFRSYPDWQNLPVVIFSHISAEDVKGCVEAFEQLNISAYHYKITTSLAQLGHSVELALQPTG